MQLNFQCRVQQRKSHYSKRVSYELRIGVETHFLPWLHLPSLEQVQNHNQGLVSWCHSQVSHVAFIYEKLWKK